MKKHTCENCENSIPGCNDKVVGCSLLNRISPYTNKKLLEPHEVQGNVYEGWFGKGSGILKNGIVVDKKATCKYHTATYKPEIILPKTCPCCNQIIER